MQVLDDKLDAIFSVTPEAVQRMIESAPVEGERGLFSYNSQQVQHIADEILQDMENSSQDCDISSRNLDVETPQGDALEKQLAEMEADLQRMWGVNEDLQAELQNSHRTSADSHTKISRDLEYAKLKAEEQEKAADEALRELRDRKRDMKMEMGNKEAEVLYEQAKAAAHQQELIAAQAQHAQEEWAWQMQLQLERIRAEKAEDKAEEAEGYLKDANAQIDNLEGQLNKAFVRMRKVAIGIHRAVNPDHEGKVHWSRSLRTAKHRITRMRLSLEEAVAHHQEGPESPGSVTYNEQCSWEVPSLTPTMCPNSLCNSQAPNCGTSCSPLSTLDGSDASTLSAITPFEGILQQLVASPSPATAAAMVCNPPAALSGLMETQGPESPAAAVLCSPSRPSSRQSVSGAAVMSPWSLASTPEHLWDTSTLTPASTCSLSPLPSRSRMSPGGALLWKVPSPAATFTQEPLWNTPSHTTTTPTTTSSSASSASSRSTCSSFEGVLRQMIATPSPATAAAMVRTPPAALSGLMETPGLESPAAAVLCSPFSAQLDCESPGSSPEYNDPYLWDFSSPVQDLFPPAHTLFGESEWESSSCDSATSWSQSSSLNGSPDSWLSAISPFERVLQQMVGTPSPATAAAMVRSPLAASPGLLETPGPRRAAAVIDVQDSRSSGSSHGYIGDCSSPAPGGSPPAHTLFCESVWESSSCESLWASPSSSSNSATSLSQSSSLSGSPDSWLSAMSPFERALQQMVATPTPATAAAMVQSPMPSSRLLVAAPGPRKAAVLCSPSSGQLVSTPRSDSAAPRVRSPFAGQQLAAPGQDMAASTVCRPYSGQLVAALTPNTTAVRGHCPPSAQSVPSPGADRNTAAPEASRPLSRQKLATTSAMPSSDVSPASPPSAVHSPTFCGSPVAGLCRSGLAGSHIRVRSTLKQKACQEAVAQRLATTSGGPTPPQRIDAASGTTASPTAGLERVALVKLRPSVRSGSKSLVSRFNSICNKENSPLPGKVATPSLGQQETPSKSKVETPLFGSANTAAKVARVELSSPALTATGTANAPCRTPLAPLSGGVNSAPGITPQALQFHHVAVPFWGLQAPAATVKVPAAAATLPTVAASRLSPPLASSSATSSRQITPGGQSAHSQAASTTADAAKDARPRAAKGALPLLLHMFLQKW